MTSSLGSSSLYTSTVQPGPSGPPFANATLPPHPPSVLFVSPPMHPPFSLMFPVVFRYLLFPLPSLTRSGFFNESRRSAELLHSISLHLVDLVYIQESNLNLSFSFRIPGYPAPRFDRTTELVFFPPMTPTLVVASSFSQGLSLSKLSTFSLYACPLFQLCRGQHFTRQLFLTLFS